MSGKFGEFAGPWMSALSKGAATEAELAGALREFTGDYQAIGALNTAWKAGGKAAAAGGRLLDGVAAGSDALAIGGDVYTEIKPEDSGRDGRGRPLAPRASTPPRPAWTAATP